MLNLAKPPRRRHTETRGGLKRKTETLHIKWKHSLRKPVSYFILYVPMISLSTVQINTSLCCLLSLHVLLGIKSWRNRDGPLISLFDHTISPACGGVWTGWKTRMNIYCIKTNVCFSETSSPPLYGYWTHRGIGHTIPAFYSWTYHQMRFGLQMNAWICVIITCSFFLGQKLAKYLAI